MIPMLANDDGMTQQTNQKRLESYVQPLNCVKMHQTAKLPKFHSSRDSDRRPSSCFHGIGGSPWFTDMLPLLTTSVQ